MYFVLVDLNLFVIKTMEAVVLVSAFLGFFGLSGVSLFSLVYRKPIKVLASTLLFLAP